MSDKIKQTGSGKQKRLSEFNNLCLSFVRAAKGSAVVDYITTTEPSGSSSAKQANDNSQSCEPKEPVAKRAKNADDDRELALFSDNFDDEQGQPNKTSKRKKYSDDWKEKYFESIAKNEDVLCQTKAVTSTMKSYNLLLNSIKLEKELGLLLDGMND